jgi:zinc/manganese transport system substrate-binding protein
MLAGATLLGSPASAAAGKPLWVVATLSTFGDLVRTVGGDHVDVAVIASPKFNPHFIEPKPSDVLKMRRADLLVHAGLDLEAWRGPLLDAAGNVKVGPGQPGELDLSQGIALLEVPQGAVSRAQGDIHLYGNPHYWLNPDNALIMAMAIAAKLSDLDPANAQDYAVRMQAWTQQLSQRIEAWRQQARALQGKEVVAYHNEWPYLLHFLGLKGEEFLEPKPGIPPTPKQLAFLQQYMTERRITAIIQPSYVPTQAGEALAKRTGATLLTLCQGVGELPTCSDTLQMLDYDITQLSQALHPTS